MTTPTLHGPSRPMSAGRPPAPLAGRLSRLTADAFTVLLHRNGMTAKALYEAAGMSCRTYTSRMVGRVPFSLNEVETFASILGVTADDVSRLAAKLGEATDLEIREVTR